MEKQSKLVIGKHTSLLKELNKILEAMEEFASKDSAKPSVNYIYKDSEVLVAADGFRLIVVKSEFFDMLEDGYYELYKKKSNNALVKLDDMVSKFVSYDQILPSKLERYSDLTIESYKQICELQAIHHRNVGITETMTFINPDLLKPILKLGFKWDIHKSKRSEDPIVLQCFDDVKELTVLIMPIKSRREY